ncbi:hypothetical protein [Methylobacterium sp. SyP6R]|uniref:hypothetical protein n=1 Tax=Methylobacterium sp. SyP6R TaxID=2718876 RepID=UPI001F208474|nr:hypothetical protein [Methylobacterium sp. SyP6R]MCF4123817.1 hypothetical protein [Methylobacterium sp. SyP6R]
MADSIGAPGVFLDNVGKAGIAGRSKVPDGGGQASVLLDKDGVAPADDAPQLRVAHLLHGAAHAALAFDLVKAAV